MRVKKLITQFTTSKLTIHLFLETHICSEL